MKILIKNANTTSHSTNGIKNIVIENERISQISDTEIEGNFNLVIDAKFKKLIPGLIDMHVHLRDPGFEERENLETGLKAALNGGVTSVGVMPNTDPCIDNPYLVDYLNLKSEKLNLAKLFSISAVTKKREGKELVEMEKISNRGIVAFSDDGNPVEDPYLLLRALEITKKIKKPIINHCEVKELSKLGCIREGFYSNYYGISGVPDVAESIMVARDIEMARYTQSHIHIAHLSTKSSVDLIRNAKTKNIPVTSEVTHNHLLFTDKSISDFSSSKKVNPPLPTIDDQLALIEGIKDGTIDIIVSDHAPYTKEEKSVDFTKAPYGISGVETLLSSLILISKNHEIDFSRLIDKVTYFPAKIFNLGLIGDIKEGYLADLVLLDLEKEWLVEEKSLVSKGKNTPFLGSTLPGKIEMVMVSGVIKIIGGRFTWN